MKDEPIQSIGNEKWLSMSEAAPLTPYSAEYLSLLARKKKLPSKKINNTWYTTSSALEAYMQRQMMRTQVQNGNLDSISSVFSVQLEKLRTYKGDVDKYSKQQLAAKPLPAKQNVVKDEIDTGPVEMALERVLDKKISSLQAITNKSSVPKIIYQQKKPIDEPTRKKIKIIEFAPRAHVKRVLSSKYLVLTVLVTVFMMSVLPVPIVFSFIDKSFTSLKEAFKDANTVMGFRPGTHANEILLLDKEGNVSIMGHVETGGQFRSYVEEGIAPLVVDSKTTVKNLSADSLDNISSEEFTLAFVTKNGNVTTEDVFLDGNVSIGKNITLHGAAKLLSELEVEGKIKSFGDAEFQNAIKVMGPAYFESLVTLEKDLKAKGSLEVEKNIAVHGSIESENSIIGKKGSFGSLSAGGSFSAGGKITLGRSDETLTINAQNITLDKNGNMVLDGNFGALSSNVVNATTTNSYIENLSVENATSTKLFSTTAYIETLTFGTCVGCSSGVFASSTLLSDNNTFTGSNVFSNLVGLEFTNSTGTSATTTNFFTDKINAALATITSLVVSDVSVGALTATNSIVTNSTTTNATTTNLYSDVASTTSFYGADLNTCTGSKALQWIDGKFSCVTVATGNAASSTLLSDNNTFTGNNTFANSTTTNSFSTTASSTNLFSTNFNLGNGEIVDSTTTNATSTNSYSAKLAALIGRITNLFVDSAEITNSTTTNATTTNFYADTASTTKFYGADLSTCSGSKALQWADGKFACIEVSNSSASSTMLSDDNTFTGNNSFDRASINELTVGNSTTTNSTSTTSYIDRLVAVIGHFTNLFADNAEITNSTTTNATSTNSFVSNFSALIGRVTNFFATDAEITNSTTTNATTTNHFTSSLIATNATTTNFFSTTASSTNLFTTTGNIGTLTSGLINGQTISSAANFTGTLTATGGLTTLSNLLLTASSTLQNFTFVNATGTSATTTNFYSTTASSTNLFSSILSVGGSAFNVLLNGRTGVGTTSPSASFAVQGANAVGGEDAPIALYVEGGKGNWANSISGSIYLKGGDGVNYAGGGGKGGSINIFSGNGGTSLDEGANGDDAGDINLLAGRGGAGDLYGRGGNITINSGGSGGGLVPGYVEIIGGAGAYSNSNGNVYIAGGTGGSGGGGNVILGVSAGGSARGNIGIGLTNPSEKLHISGNLLVTGNSTTTSATTTNFFSTTASSTNLFTTTGNIGTLTSGLINGQTISSTANFTGTLTATGGLTTLSNLLLTASSTLQNFTFVNATGTSATTTNFYSTTASSTNLFSSLLSVGGSNGLNVIANGTVGIGTSTPNNHLDIYDVTKPAIGFSGASGPTYKWTIGMDMANGGKFSIASSTALGTLDRFVIDGNGNVGIGTTIPATKLEVRNVTNSPAEIRVTNAQGGASSSAILSLQSGNNTSDQFQIFKVPGTYAGYKTIQARDAGVYTATGNMTFLNDNASGAIMFAAGGSATAHLTISSAGNVGIGTTNPTEMLTVAGNLLVSGNSTTTSATTTNLFSTTASSTNLFSSLLSVGNAALNVNSTGNVGVGTTTPSRKFDVWGTAKFGDSSRGVVIGSNLTINDHNLWISMNTDNAVMRTYGDGSSITLQAGTSANYPGKIVINAAGNNTGENGAMQFFTSDTTNELEKMRISRTGNVGIGTTDPSQKLHVAGNLLVTGNATTTNFYSTNASIGSLGVGTSTTTSGVIQTTGDVYVGGSLTVAGSLTSSASNGQIQFLAVPTGTGIDQGSVYINPTSAGTNNVLTGWAVNGTEKARIDAEGDMQILGTFNSTNSSGTSQLDGNLTVLGNTVIGNSTSDTLTVNSRISSDLTPSADNLYSLGSVSNRWSTFYAVTAGFNEIAVASSTLSSFIINSDNPSNDTEDATLEFSRGIATPNAVLKWNSSSDRFEFNNFPLYLTNVLNVAGTGNSTIAGLLTLSSTPAGSGLGNGSLYINPSSASTDYTLFGAGVNGVERFRIDAEGDTTIQGSLGVENSLYDITQDTLSINDKIKVVGNEIKDSSDTTRITLGSTNAITGALSISNLTSGRVPYAGTSGTLSDSSALLWDNSLSRLTATYASTSALSVSENAYFPGSSIWNSSGNVGIGVTNPTQKLVVDGGNIGTTVGSGMVARLQSAGIINSRTELGFSYSGATGSYAPVMIGYQSTTFSGYTKGNFFVATRDVTTDDAPIERLTITTEGKVGIGVTNPSVADFQVAGSGYFTSGLAVGNTNLTSGVVNVGTGYRIGNTAASNAVLRGDGTNFVSSASQALTKTDDTNVTLTLGGTPGSALLDAVSITVGWNGQLGVARGGTGAATFTSNGVLYGNTTGAIQATAQGGANTILTANDGAPSFSASPTIGTSLTTPLLIGGTTNSSSLEIRSTSGAGTTDHIKFTVGNNGGTEAMRIVSGGNIGIGLTDPISRFTIDKATSTTNVGEAVIQRLQGASASNARTELGFTYSGASGFYSPVVIGYQSTSFTGYTAGSLYFATREDTVTDSAPLERMTITSSGNVGIGTTNPSEKLNVSGNLLVSGNATTTNLFSTTASFTNLSTNNLTISELLFTRATGTSATTTNFFSTTASSTNLFSTNFNFGTGSMGNLTVSDLLFTRATGTAATTTNFYSTTSSSTNLFSSLASVGGSQGLNVIANGRVGIGTAAPISALDVYGSGAGAQLRVRTASAGSLLISALNSNEVDMRTTNASDLSLGTNGANNLFIKQSTGNIGVGTTSPEYRLDISGASTGSDLRVWNTSATVGTFNRFWNDQATGLTLGVYGSSYASGSVFNVGANGAMLASTNAGPLGIGTFGVAQPLTFNTNSSERMRIDSAGNVGIGLTNPSSKLQIDAGTATASALKFTANATTGILSTDGFDVGIDTTGIAEIRQRENNSIKFFTNNAENMSLTNGGILTVANGQIRGVAGSSAGTPSFAFSSDNNTGIFNPSAGVLAFTTSGAEQIRITSGGNVGIGTTDPSEKLHVVGNMIVSGNSTTTNATTTNFYSAKITTLAGIFADLVSDTFTVGDLTATGAIITRSTTTSATTTTLFSTTASSTNLFSSLLSVGGSNGLNVIANGTVGIGTSTPNNHLDIFDTTKPAIGFSGASGPTYKWTMGMDMANGGRFSIASSTALGTLDRFVIDGSGDVGIGTTLPATKLEVRNDANSTTELRVTNSQGGALANAILSIQSGGTASDQFQMFKASATYAGYKVLQARDAGIYTVTGNLTFLNDNAAGAIRFAAGGSATAHLTIGSNGYIGAGTTTPNNKLDIYDTSKPAIGFSGVTGSTYKWTVGMDLANGGRFSIASSTALGTLDRFVIDGNGNIGIGTTAPQASALQVASSATRESFASSILVTDKTDYTEGMFFGYDSTSDYGVIAASQYGVGWRNLVLNPVAGFVGIGMTNPSVALDVTGDIEYSGTITDVSDMRLKENIQDYGDGEGLAVINNIDVKTFNMIGSAKNEVGFIAQQVQDVFGQAVSVIDPKEGYLGVSYVSFIPVLTKAIQEVYAQLTELKGAVLALADKVVSKEIVAIDRFCIGSTCINEQQLINILQSSGQTVNAKSSTSTDTSTSTATTTAEVTGSIDISTSTSTAPIITESDSTTSTTTASQAADTTATSTADTSNTVSDSTVTETTTSETAASTETTTATSSDSISLE